MSSVLVSESSIQTIQLCAALKTMDGWFLVLNLYVCFGLCGNRMLLTKKFAFLNELYMMFSKAKIQYKQKKLYNIKNWNYYMKTIQESLANANVKHATAVHV